MSSIKRRATSQVLPRVVMALAGTLLCISALQAQVSRPSNENLNPKLAAPAAASAVPRVVRITGTLTDEAGKPLSGPVDLHFSIYAEQNDAAPVWQETQTLNLDEQGHYTVLLGAMQPEGLPVDLFTSGEARWLGVSAGTLPEQPRTLLVSVPYALKAGDAETLGGKPASAYLLAQPEQTSGPVTSQPASQPTAGLAATQDIAKPGKAPGNPKPQTTTTKMQYYVPVFADSSGDLTDSVIYQNGNNVGIGTTSPSQALEVNGNIALTPANGTITGPSSLTFEETGDMFGAVALVLQDRVGVAGAVFQQAGTVDLVDEVFKGLTFQRNLRCENRPSASFISTPEFQFGIHDDPTLVVSDSASAFRKGTVSITAPATTGNPPAALSTQATDINTSNYGVFALSNGPNGGGVYGEANNGNQSVGVWGSSSGGQAGLFSGNVQVTGSISKASGSFKIDHPLDPANKYLYHSFVESPDMKDLYDGVAVLDANGEAVVQLPEWFEALNRDFRYQLTCIGGFAPVYIAEEISQNQFKIAGGKAGMKVSWQVTGTRQDAWANAHRIPVEETKPGNERGFYLHPELYGAPPERSIEWAAHPELMRHAKIGRPSERGISKAENQKPLSSSITATTRRDP